MMSSSGDAFSLDVERSVCLSLSLGSTPIKHNSSNSGEDRPNKLIFASDQEFIHREGNSLQLTSLPKPKVETADTTVPLSKRLQASIPSDLSSLSASYSDSQHGTAFAWSEYGQGFSCCAFNFKRSWIAYVPKKVRPDILVSTFPRKQVIFTLGGGTTIDYSDVAFSRDGARVAAVGKCTMDRKLWIWQLEGDQDHELRADHSECRIMPLIAVDLDCFHASCDFNPCDSCQIALLAATGSKITVCKLVEIWDTIDVELVHHKAKIPVSTEDGISVGSLTFTAFAWESKDTVIAGTSSGSMVICDAHDPDRAIILDDSCHASPITGILITLKSMIVGFQNGHIQCWQRFQFDQDRPRMQSEVVMHSPLLNLACTAEFTRIVACAQNGDLYLLDLEAGAVETSSNGGAKAVDDRQSCSPQLERVASLHQGMVTALCPVVLAGKAAYSVMISGGSDGTVRAWKDSPLQASSSTMSLCLATLDVKSPVTCLTALSGYPVFAVGTVCGVLQFVVVHRNTGAIDFGSTEPIIRMKVVLAENLCSTPITCLSYNHNKKRLAAGCYSTGFAFIVNAEPSNRCVIGVARTADSQALASVFWHPESEYVLILISTKGTLTYVDTTLMNGSPELARPIAVLRMEGDTNVIAVAISSNMTVDHLFYVSRLGAKTIERFKLPPVEGAAQCPRLACHDAAPLEMSNPCANLVSSMKHNILVGGSIGGQLNIFKAHLHSGVKLHGTFALHHGPILAISFTADGSRLYTSGADGSIFVCRVVGYNGYQPILSTSEYDIAVSSLLPSRFVWNESPHQEHSNWKGSVAVLHAKQLDDANPCVENATLRDECWLNKASERFRSDQEECLKFEKDAIRDKIRDMSERVAGLLKENALRNPSEQLEMSEFVIDVAGEEALKASVKEEVEKASKQNAAEIETLRTEIERIQRECRDTMSVQKCEICSFHKPDIVVSNFPVKKRSEKEIRQSEIVTLLRRGEISDIRRNPSKASRTGLCWSGLTHDLTSVNHGDFEQQIYVIQARDKPIGTEVDGYTASNETLEAMSEKFEDLGTELSSQNLMYPPVAVRTDTQRRTQIMLLKNLIRSAASEFNDKFDKLKDEKDAVSYDIETKCKRMKEILHDLDRVEDGIVPEFLGSGITGCIFDLDDDGPVPKADVGNMHDRVEGVTPESLDDAPRALIDMMDGTVKAKKKLLLKVPLEPERWMVDLRYEDMTDEQRNQFDQYKRRENEFAELVEQNRVALDLELKKIRSEITGAISIFDKKLEYFIATRRNAQNLIATYELHALQLENAIQTKECYRVVSFEMRNRILHLNDKRRRLSAVTAQVQAEMSKAQNECNIAMEEDKALERGFRRSIQQCSKEPLDQEMVKVLVQLFKSRDLDQTIASNARPTRATSSKSGSRPSKETVDRRSSYSRYSGREGSTWRELQQHSVGSFHKSSGRGSSDRRLNTALSEAVVAAQHLANAPVVRAVRNDPFPDDEPFESKHEATKCRVLQFSHIPEGFHLSREIWGGLQLLRNVKIEHEIRVEEASQKILQVKQVYDAAKQQLDSCTEKINKLSTELNDVLEMGKTEFSQADVLVRLKQGQDEIMSKVVPAHPKDPVLVPLNLIEDANETIRSLSEQKVMFLKKTKAFRRKIHIMHWNQEYLDLMATDAKERFIDFQFLRVDNKLMKILAGDEEESDETKIARADAQQEKRQKNHRETIAKLERESQELQKIIDARNTENQRLKVRIQQSQASVLTKHGEFLKQMEENQLSNKSDNKMQYIMRRGKIVARIKSQADELEALKVELDRLRRKTFPLFSSATQHRGRNPDERC